MWGVTPTERWNWADLKERVQQHGIRNSLLLAPMPTASTAQILGNNESIEPYTSNIYTRRVLSGEFQVVNHHLLKDLTDRGLWNEDMKLRLIAANGSVQNITDFPEDLKVCVRVCLARLRGVCCFDYALRFCVCVRACVRIVPFRGACRLDYAPFPHGLSHCALLFPHAAAFHACCLPLCKARLSFCFFLNFHLAAD